MKTLALCAILIATLFVKHSSAQQWGPAGSPTGGCDSAYQPQPVILVTPPQPQPPPPPAAEPVRPVIHEYRWPDSASAPAAFSVVAKDGTVRFALAVWIQDGTLHYVAKDGKQERLPLDAVDRAATRQLNAERRLHLWLPGEATRP
jgi:hypothetical protein